MKKISRRSWLSIAAAGSASAFMQSASAAGMQSRSLPEKWDMEVDVVVLGCGAAGMMAAVQAADGGALVAVFDKGQSPYHTSTRLNGGCFAACGSRIQKENGVKDTPEDFAKNISDYGDGMSLMDPVLTFAKNSGAAFDWLVDAGLAPGFWQPYNGHVIPRTVRQNTYNGKDYVDVLTKALDARGIKIHHDHALVRFFFDEKTNTCVGAECGTGTNAVKVRAKKGIVMATGGITGSAKEVAKWSPVLAHAVTIGGGSNDGEAMRIAVRDLGTPLTHMQYFAEYPYARALGEGRGPQIRYQYFVENGGMLVNKDGKRFVNEDLAPTQISPYMKKNAGQCMYLLMTRDILERTAKKYPFGSLFSSPQWTRDKFNEELAKGRVLSEGNTIEEAAAKAGIDGKALKAQVEEWEQMVDAKKDTQFGRKKIGQRLGQGPYLIARIDLWICLSMGGLKVSKAYEVLGWNDQPIKGLYAAGETVGGIHGVNYLGGNACGFAHTSGYVVGRLLSGQSVSL